MSNLFVFMDYENFHVYSTRQLRIEITNQGLDKLLNLCLGLGSMSKKDNFVVAANWDNFRGQKDYFSRKLVQIVDVYEKGSNVSDGYLIVQAMVKINEVAEGDHVVIIGGDGVYTGLVRYLLSRDVAVHIFSWKDCLSDSLTINDNVHEVSLEDVFEVNSGDHVQNGWFNAIGVNPDEYAIISRAMSFPCLFFVATANVIYKNQSDIRYKHITTYQQANKFLEDCVDKLGIFHIEWNPNPDRENQMQKALVLNKENEKVKIVMGQRKVIA